MMNGIKEASSTSPKTQQHKSTARRRSATQASLFSMSQGADDNSSYYKNNTSGVSHRRTVTNAASHPQEGHAHTRRVNSYGSHSHGPGHGHPHHRPKMKSSQRWFSRIVSSRSPTLPHSQPSSSQHATATTTTNKPKNMSFKLGRRFMFQTMLLILFLYVISIIYFAPVSLLRPVDDHVMPTDMSSLKPLSPEAAPSSSTTSTSSLTHSSENNHHNTPLHSKTNAYFDTTETTTATATVTSALTRKLEQMQQEAMELSKTRAQSRQSKTRPPPPTLPSPSIPVSSTSSQTDTKSLQLHTFQLNSAYNPPLQKPIPTIPDDLCGIVAKTSAAKYMESDQNNPLHNPFPNQHNLNKNSVVLITGILNPLGFHLAMELHDQCGVNRVIGMDPMLPNTILYRLDLMRKLAILTKRIPSLYQPIYVSHVGVSPKSKTETTRKEVDIVSKFKPTHIVHLGAMEGAYSDAISVGGAGGSGSAYGSGRPMLEFREAFISMEQILSSIQNMEHGKRPHFTYASSKHWGEPIFAGATKLGEELIASTYRKLHGVHSVAIRLGNLYGPWCSKRGTDFYNRMDHLVRGHSDLLPLLEEEKKEWTYVKDAIDVIIAAMQYRPVGTSDVALTANGYKESMTGLISQAENILQGNEVSNQSQIQHESNHSNLITLSAPTSIKRGLTQTLAWHLDNTLPFGSALNEHNTAPLLSKRSLETGNDFLNRSSQSICAPDDRICLYGMPTFPCASECASDKSTCTPSIFDDVLEVSKRITNDCDVVLYTSFLDLERDEKLCLETVVQSKQLQPNEKVCNVAFVSKYHYRVQEIISKKKNGKAGEEFEKRFKKQNGNIVEVGWNLIWVDDKDPISHAEQFLLKLSPGKFFSSAVRYAMYVDPSLQVTPRTDDVLFLAEAMHRRAAPERKATLTNPQKEKIKVRLPAETEKEAVFLAPTIKFPKGVPRPSKVSVNTATKIFKEEIGIDPDSTDPKSLIQQREFYGRVTSYLDRHDIRPISEPKYGFEMNVWIRSMWLIHDIRQEVGRQLRCEWYEEHLLWENNLDQLSFAYIIGKKELERRIGRNEMDDEDKKLLAPLEPWEEAVLDTKDWIPLLNADNGIRPHIETIDLD